MFIEDRRYDAFRARGRFFDDVDDMDLEIAEVVRDCCVAHVSMFVRW